MTFCLFIAPTSIIAEVPPSISTQATPDEFHFHFTRVNQMTPAFYKWQYIFTLELNEFQRPLKDAKVMRQAIDWVWKMIQIGNFSQPRFHMELARNAQLLDYRYQTLVESKRNIDQLIAASQPTTSKVLRPRRQVLAALGGAVFGGIATGLFNLFSPKVDPVLSHYIDLSTQHFQTINSKLSSLSSQVWILKNLTYDLQDLIVTSMAQLERTIELQETAYALIQELDDLFAILENSQDTLFQAILDGLNNRISAKLITPLMIESLYQTLPSKIPTPLCSAIDLSVTYHFYSLPVDLYLHKGTLTMLINIPLYHPANLFEILAYTPSPQLMNGILMQVESPNRFLIINPTRTLYTEATTEDMDSCMIIGDIRLCESLNIFKRSPKSCLYSLFQSQAAEIREYCKITVALHDNAQISHWHANVFVLSTPKTISIQYICGKDKTVSKQYIAGRHLITILPECKASADDFYIVERRNVTLGRNNIQIPALLRDIFNLTAIIHSLDTPNSLVLPGNIQDAWERLASRDHSPAYVPMEDLIQAAKDIHQQAQSAVSYWLGHLISISVLILVLCIIIYICRRYPMARNVLDCCSRNPPRHHVIGENLTEGIAMNELAEPIATYHRESADAPLDRLTFRLQHP